MELLFTKINGTNFSLDYEKLKQSIYDEFKDTCNKVEVFVLNNFPLAINSQASLDLLIFLKVHASLNSRPKIHTGDNNNDFVYVSSLIIAVSIIKEYKKSNIEIDEEDIIIDDSYVDFKDNATKLKWGLTNFLNESGCLPNREKITVHPVFWVVNENNHEIQENTIISDHLTFKELKKCIALNSYLRYSGYADWNNDPYFEVSIQDLFEKISKESDFGFLTKQKIDRFQKPFGPASLKAFDSIGNKLVIVQGKAGTGKSSDLLHWMLKKSENGNKASFLTYNQLLVNEISKQIKGHENTLTDEFREKKASTTAYTIHSFMYNISKKLGVCLLMNAQRIEELKTKLENRCLIINTVFSEVQETNKRYSRNEMKTFFQNRMDLEKATKMEAIDLINHFETFKDFLDNKTTVSHIEMYKKFKITQIQESNNSKVFLKDYHNVLSNIYKAIVNFESFFKEFEIENKFELLENYLNLKKTILKNDGSGEIDLEELKKRYKRSINSFKHGRALYIDEAQDCHPLERDIFFELFGTNNIILSTGGKEQLIRYTELCNWKISRAKNIDYYQYPKKRKSFRMKPAIAALANHIATTFGIDLNIEPLDTEDHGAIIIDRNNSNDLDRKAAIINELLRKGTLMGCSNYDALLLLKNSKDKDFIFSDSLSDSLNVSNKDEKMTDFTINEFDVIKITKKTERVTWPLLTVADKIINEARFWNATGKVDKKKQGIPGSLSIRAIYYESSRGLEAWSVMCFNIDNFFDLKKEEKEAENFLLEEIMEFEERKNKYAATWILMAITRAIDTCYLELSNSDNEFNRCINNFIQLHPEYIEFK